MRNCAVKHTITVYLLHANNNSYYAILKVNDINKLVQAAIANCTLHIEHQKNLPFGRLF